MKFNNSLYMGLCLLLLWSNNYIFCQYPKITATIRNLAGNSFNPMIASVNDVPNRLPIRCVKDVNTLLNYNAVNLCGGEAGKYLSIVEINFCLSSPKTIWFGAGGDFGYGGSGFINNEWAGAIPGIWVTNPNQARWYEFKLQRGRHTFKILGAEDCCDGLTTTYLSWNNGAPAAIPVTIENLKGECEALSRIEADEAKAVAEAKAKAEAEARAKADAEAKAKAEAEARAKAESNKVLSFNSNQSFLLDC